MRTALRPIARTQVSKLDSYPAPVGGWNARDALTGMKPTDAVALVNWMPKASYLEMRGGVANHASGMTGNGKTLATYNSLSGANKLFCLTATGTYDVSTAGAVGASLAARTNGKHQHVNFGDGTSNWLILVNGVDKPLYYDGSAWVAVDNASTPALTGVTTTDIISVNSFHDRLFFILKNSLSVWYLAAGDAGGALTEFSFAGVAQKGGYLMAMGTWTVDAGDGPDDRAVFVTSEGEVLIYVGTDPSAAATWGLVGRYVIGKPLGRRCLVGYGSDLVVLTENGTYPLTAAIQSAAIDYTKALSSKIEPAFTEAARLYGDTFGWRAMVYPAQQALIVNIPKAEDGTHEQYVMNTLTKAWTRFTGWNAEDFAIFNKDLYFTVGTTVVKAWTGVSDFGNNIEYYGKTAFSDFKSGSPKQFLLFRPTLAISGAVNYLSGIDVDFQDVAITGAASYTVNASGVYGTARWGQATWAPGLMIKKEWTSPAQNLGTWAAGKLKINTNNVSVRWHSCDYMWKGGGPL